MTDSTADSTTDPTTDDEYTGPSIPRPLGERLRTALGLDERPRTFGDWVDALALVADRDGLDVGPDLLCTTDDSPHRATFDGEVRHYQCVQDALVLPFLADGVDSVEIETHSPESGAEIDLTVTADGVTVTPSDAVMSFGVAADVEEPAADVPSPIVAYGRFCPYGHAFPSRTEYERWAADADAVTVAVSVDDSFELARAIGRVVRDGPGTGRGT